MSENEKTGLADAGPESVRDGLNDASGSADRQLGKGDRPSLVDALGMDEDVEFEPPRIDIRCRVDWTDDVD